MVHQTKAKQINQQTIRNLGIMTAVMVWVKINWWLRAEEGLVLGDKGEQSFNSIFYSLLHYHRWIIDYTSTSLDKI